MTHGAACHFQLTVFLSASSLLFLFFNGGAGVVTFGASGFNLSVRGCGGVCERRSALLPPCCPW